MEKSKCKSQSPEKDIKEELHDPEIQKFNIPHNKITPPKHHSPSQTTPQYNKILDPRTVSPEDIFNPKINDISPPPKCWGLDPKGIPKPKIPEGILISHNKNFNTTSEFNHSTNLNKIEPPILDHELKPRNKIIAPKDSPFIKQSVVGENKNKPSETRDKPPFDKTQKELLKKITDQINQLTPKFLEYIAYAKKEGKQKVPTPYPNIGTRITNKFKVWISDNEPNPNKRKQLLNQINEINQKKSLNLIIKHYVKTTTETQKNISNQFKAYGLFVGPHKIQNIALKQVFHNNLKSVKERFPKGRTRTLTIGEMHELAKSRGGKCLSTEYVNAQTKLKWQCGKCTYEWEATPHSIKNLSTWCPKCAKRIKGTMKEMQELAKSRGGKCLSKDYIGAKVPLKWQCGVCDHIWTSTPDNIKNKGSWCPKCSKEGISERICRSYFEAIFGKSFKKFRPEWLKSTKGRSMHLDGYNDKLQLAFEHQGIQHYEFTPFFHKNEKEFIQRLKNDELTRIACKVNGVVLIEIPYQVSYEEMGDYIRTQCKAKGFKIPSRGMNVNFQDLKVNKEDLLKEMQELAKVKGGECLSTEYINANTHLRWRCGECNYEWQASPNNIKNNLSGKSTERGTWCPKCAGKLRGTIEEMQELAKSRKGECLSDEYINAHKKLLWRCKAGHEWWSTPYNIKNKSGWCPQCSKRKFNIEKMQKFAVSKGGVCLSTIYKNCMTHLLWKCAECGHEWYATYNYLKTSNRWCPQCQKKDKLKG